MAVGGNQRARTFFKQHGWDEVGSDKIETKYTSRAAQLYRKQVEKDVAKAMTDAGSAPSTAATITKAPGNNGSVTSTATGQNTRPVSATAAKSRLTASAPRRLHGTGKSTGLGIKKITTAQIDDSLFDQAPAEEQPEPDIDELSEKIEDSVAAPTASRFTMDALEEKKRPAMQRGKDGHLTLDTSSDFFSDPLGQSSSKLGRQDSLDKSPVGHTAGRPTTFGTRPGRSQASSAATTVDSSVAQQRFGNAKSISSSAFFNEDNKESDYERQGRLQQFQGSSAISSDAYFGRQSNRQGGMGGGGGGADSFDVSASELVSKISLTARQDMQQLKAMASEAGSKLSQMAQSFIRDLQGGY